MAYTLPGNNTPLSSIIWGQIAREKVTLNLNVEKNVSGLFWTLRFTYQTPLDDFTYLNTCLIGKNGIMRCSSNPGN